MQNTPNVVQIEAATLPVKPVRPRVFLNTALAGVIGLFVAVVWIFIKEYVDDTLKTPEDIEKLLGLPVLGSIAKLNFENGAEILYVRKHPRSIISEAFRTLRTNLEFIHPLKTVLVTSPGPEEGKSTIAANLAEIISQVNKQVILLDADMRKPKVHQILGIPNRIGLSDVFRTHHWENQDVLRPVGDSKYLRVITSGNIPPNPADLLGSELMLKFLEELKKLSDIVVIDSPPSLVSDSQILSTRVDGVIVVIKPGFTRINAAKTTVEQMKRSGAKLIGVVINGIPKEYSYYYGGSYYSSDQEKMYDGYVEEGEVGNKK
jgi:capsular exopolysaccharide synthesis family protein